MFAIAALIVFILALFGVHPINMLYLGLALIAAHLVWAIAPMWPWRRR